MDMAKHPLTRLRNLGPRMAESLVAIGVEDEASLRALGPVETYLRLRLAFPHLANRMALYALYGALTDQNCMRLPQETKEWLEAQIQDR
jgi:hypothetical protein